MNKEGYMCKKQELELDIKEITHLLELVKSHSIVNERLLSRLSVLKKELERAVNDYFDNEFTVEGVATEAVRVYPHLLSASKQFPALENLVRLVGSLRLCGETGPRFLREKNIEITSQNTSALQTEENT